MNMTSTNSEDKRKFQLGSAKLYLLNYVIIVVFVWHAESIKLKLEGKQLITLCL